MKCLNCNKIINNEKYCNLLCRNSHRKKTNYYRNIGFKGGIIRAKNMKKKGLLFFNSEFQKKMAQRAIKINKKNKTSAVFDPNWKSSHKYGFQISKNLTKAHASCKKNQSGYYNPIIQEKGRKEALKSLLNKNNYFKNIKWDSKSEAEIAANIYYQYKIRFIKGKNYQIPIGNTHYPYRYDFFINNIFIDYHNIPEFLMRKKETKKEYYQRRRYNLNKYGYQNNSLLVLP